jgi:hypothetical protein
MEAHRSACQRQHRVFGHYLAIQAWLRNLDCIAVKREDLEVYLGLERFKSERVKWLLEDLEPWFPYNRVFYKASAESSLHSLFLSRVKIGGWLPTASMTTKQRIAKIASESPKTALFFEGGPRKKQITEVDVVRYLAILDSGLSSPTGALSAAA